MSKAEFTASAENGSQRTDQQSANGNSARSWEEIFGDPNEDWSARLKSVPEWLDKKDAYKAYLSSAAWAAKRLAVIELAGNRCQVCNSPNRLDVHHRTYERIGDEAAGDLTVLCRRCHSLFHEKSGLSQAKPKKRKKPKLPKRKRPRQKKRKIPIDSIQHIHREKLRYRVLKTKCPLCKAPSGINCTGIRPGFIHRERILKSET